MSAPASSLKPCSVLLADDSKTMRNAVSRILQEDPRIQFLGVAENFEQTLQMTADLKPTVVLMDLHMPDERGFDPQFIKSQLLLSAQHIVVMSIWNDKQAQVLAGKYGAADLLDKGNLVATLVPAILKLC
ncbi:MAG TPA: response regulator [Candidatus Acidoferrum sp.]|jgi:DNA-binding NarL/FixJ family response regulator